ncbi:SURF1 family protein [Mumia zhuanghuii]|uniref:SURF1-like protein n=1 Tax=Mumia zhuanghuii TaxID=2585211 RepID=A0A5C4MNF1_9ACTN|nr:SURF1 family protein [Mumia zhuanghuii]TNC45921.1 SURF1 family protein [Mumia zhuanghuii]
MTRRWLAFALFVVLLAGVCTWLGSWQFGRLEDRVARNDVTRHNMVAPPVPVDEVATSDIDQSEDNEWRQVEVTGTYDTANQVIVKYQTRDEGSGVDVVTPLRTADGRAVLVERGWLPSANRTGADVDVPAAPSGEVTVVGWWRANDNVPVRAAQPDASRQVRAVSTLGVAPTLDYPLYEGGYLLLEKQDPPTKGFLLPDGPELGQGPHFFYGLQWWFFGALGLIGFLWFAWAEAHPRGPRKAGHARPGQRSVPAARAAAERAAAARAGGHTAAPGSQRPEGTSVDRQHDAGDVRSGR